MDEKLAREGICEIGRRMYARNMVAANDGNISVRLDEGRVVCTPSGVSKGYMTPEMLVTVDPDGRRLSGEGDMTSEIRMHLRIYRERPEVNAVTHAHPPHATVFAITGTPLPEGILPEVEVLLGPVPTVAYATPGTTRLPDLLAARLAPGITTMILDHHGAVSFDTTLELAWFHLETLESYCRVLLLCRQVGAPLPLDAENMRALMEVKRKLNLADPRMAEL